MWQRVGRRSRNGNVVWTLWVENGGPEMTTSSAERGWDSDRRSGDRQDGKGLEEACGIFLPIMPGGSTHPSKAAPL